MRGDEEAVGRIGPLFEDHPDPERLKPPAAAFAPHPDPLDREGIAGEPDRLALPGAAVIEAEVVSSRAPMHWMKATLIKAFAA